MSLLRSASVRSTILSPPQLPSPDEPIFKDLQAPNGARNAFAWHPTTRSFTTYTHSFSDSLFSSTLRSFLQLLAADMSEAVTRHTWNWFVNALPPQAQANEIISHQKKQSPPSSSTARHNYILAILWDLDDEFASAVLNYPYQPDDSEAYQTIVRMWIQAQFQKIIDRSSTMSPPVSCPNIFADVMDRIEDTQECERLAGQPWVDGMVYVPVAKNATTESERVDTFSHGSIPSQPVLASWLDQLENMAECESCGLTVSNVLDVLADQEFMSQLPEKQWEAVYDLLILLVLSRPGEEEFMGEYLWPEEGMVHFRRLLSRLEWFHRRYSASGSSSLSRLQTVWHAVQ